jgi:hypothetical protein
MEVKCDNNDLKYRDKCLQGSIQKNLNGIWEIAKEVKYQIFVRRKAVFLIGIKTYSSFNV